MIIPVKKGKWELCYDHKLVRKLTAGGYTGTQYKSLKGWYHVCFDGTTSPSYPREYQATNWFRERVAKLLEVA